MRPKQRFIFTQQTFFMINFFVYKEDAQKKWRYKMESIVLQLAKEFQLKELQVENAIRLIDEGNTIPFIARYRKEVTGDWMTVY